MDNYENLGTIGQGTYGVVLKARHKETGQIVAIKKFKESDDDEQVRKTALREVRILKQLRHENIVTLIEVFRRKGKLYLVFEYVDRTLLEDLERHPNGMDPLDVKKVMWQLVRSIEFCHAHNVIHRDIKPENLLISKNGCLKLCDFGFARTLAGPGARYTDYVSTRWYRSPELLVGDASYGKAVDLWAMGCLMAEIMNGLPLFPGESDVDQIFHIVRTFGTLTPRMMDLAKQNPLFVGVKLPEVKSLDPLENKLPNADPLALDVIKRCLAYEPLQRPTCSELLRHKYFEGFSEWFYPQLQEAMEKDRAAFVMQKRTRKHKRDKLKTADGEKSRRGIKSKNSLLSDTQREDMNNSKLEGDQDDLILQEAHEEELKREQELERERARIAEKEREKAVEQKLREEIANKNRDNPEGPNWKRPDRESWDKERAANLRSELRSRENREEAEVISQVRIKEKAWEKEKERIREERERDRAMLQSEQREASRNYNRKSRQTMKSQNADGRDTSLSWTDSSRVEREAHNVSRGHAKKSRSRSRKKKDGKHNTKGRNSNAGESKEESQVLDRDDDYSSDPDHEQDENNDVDSHALADTHSHNTMNQHSVHADDFGELQPHNTGRKTRQGGQRKRKTKQHQGSSRNRFRVNDDADSTGRSVAAGNSVLSGYSEASTEDRGYHESESKGNQTARRDGNSQIGINEDEYQRMVAMPALSSEVEGTNVDSNAVQEDIDAFGNGISSVTSLYSSIGPVKTLPSVSEGDDDEDVQQVLDEPVHGGDGSEGDPDEGKEGYEEYYGSSMSNQKSHREHRRNKEKHTDHGLSVTGGRPLAQMGSNKSRQQLDGPQPSRPGRSGQNYRQPTNRQQHTFNMNSTLNKSLLSSNQGIQGRSTRQAFPQASGNFASGTNVNYSTGKPKNMQFPNNRQHVASLSPIAGHHIGGGGPNQKNYGGNTGGPANVSNPTAQGRNVNVNPSAANIPGGNIRRGAAPRTPQTRSRHVAPSNLSLRGTSTGFGMSFGGGGGSHLGGSNSGVRLM